MSKHLLSIFVSFFLVGQLSAQVPPNAVADDYNSIFKTVKWRSIGPFRGGRSNAGCGVVVLHNVSDDREPLLDALHAARISEDRVEFG